jgi:opacity protein-like surface antigen
MKFQLKGLAYIFFSSLVLSAPVLASTAVVTHSYYKGESTARNIASAPINSVDKFEIIGGLGIAKLRAGNAELAVTRSETDRLKQTNANSFNTTATQLGVGYVHYFVNTQQYPDQILWFTSIEPELNFYTLTGGSIKGNVWRFGNSNFNQLSYEIPVRSMRLMLDAALTVASYNQLSLYGIAGIGNAWNRISYKDQDGSSDSCANQNLSLDGNTSSHFAWEVGAGLTYEFNQHIGLSIEYLYTYLGTVKTSARGNTGNISVPIAAPARFNLKPQTALLILHIAL